MQSKHKSLSHNVDFKISINLTFKSGLDFNTYMSIYHQYTIYLSMCLKFCHLSLITKDFFGKDFKGCIALKNMTGFAFSYLGQYGQKSFVQGI